MSTDAAVLVAAGLVALMMVAIVAAVRGLRTRARFRPMQVEHANEILLAPPTSFPAFPTAADRLLLDAVRDQVSAEISVESLPDHGPDVDGRINPRTPRALGRGGPTGVELVPFELVPLDLVPAELPPFDFTRLTVVPTHPTGVAPPAGVEPARARAVAGAGAGELTPFDFAQLKGAPFQPAYARLVQVQAAQVRAAKARAAQVDLDGVDLTDDGVVIDLTDSGPALELAARLSLSVPWPQTERTIPLCPVDPVLQVLIDRVRVKQAVARHGRLPPRRAGDQQAPSA